MEIRSDDTVGRIAARHPLATRVFARHGIDFCCGGGLPLAKVCERRGLNVDQLLHEIDRELSGSKEPEMRWDLVPSDRLVEHILETYHVPLKEELPRLETMAEKVARVHGDKQPEQLPALHTTIAELRAELESHMQREEQELFPAIAEGRTADALELLAELERDHEAAGSALHRLRELTGDFNVPEGACNTWRALWHGLEAFEKAMHNHVHLENNVLFPAVAGAREP